MPLYIDRIMVRNLGVCEYEPIWRAMQTFTASRNTTTIDEIWCLQHRPVYTQGQAGRAEHILNAGKIPVVAIDRGGQVTYHGPGQLVFYTLIDLTRKQLGIKKFVAMLEQGVIDWLQKRHVTANRKENAPGVYVGGAKIAALGLRVRHGRTFHGLSINVDMDLSPFRGINPCGYANMPVTQVCAVCDFVSLEDAQNELLAHFTQGLGYTEISYENHL